MTDGRPTPPGWYPDPDDPARLRWWDGEAWTSDRRIVPTPSTGRAHGLADISDWMRSLFRTLWHRAGQLLALAFVFGLAPAVLLAAATWAAIADVAVVDEEVIGWNRADALPLALAVVLYLVATVGFAQAAGHQLLAASIDRPVPWQGSIPPGLRSVVRLIGYGVVVAVAVVAAVAVLVLIAATVPLLLVPVVPALVVVAVWAYIKLSFVPVAALGALGGTNLFRASAAVSGGRFWPVFGRLVLLALVGTTAGVAFNVVTLPLQSTATIDPSAIQTDDDGQIEDFAMRDVVPDAGTLGVLVVLATLVQSAQTAIAVAGHATLYRDGGGPTDLLDGTVDGDDAGSPIVR